MNRLVKDFVTRKIENKTADIISAADSEIVISRKVWALELAVALLGGLVIGMFLSPRKNVEWKIASNNNINSGDEDNEDYYDDDDDPDGDDLKNSGKFIKL